MRAFLDPNVIIAALLSPGGVPAAILVAWQSGAFELVLSERLLDELREPPLSTVAPTETADQRWVRLQVEELGKPATRSAKTSHVLCLAYAARMLISNDGVARCRQWMSQRYPEQFLPTPELMLRPTRLASILRSWNWL